MSSLSEKIQEREPEVGPHRQEDFWQPPTHELEPAPQARPAFRADACADCGKEFLVGARFCHACGEARYPRPNQLKRFSEAALNILDFNRLKAALGLTAISLVLFIMGVGCLLGAIFTGAVYSPNTILDWQAVQIWRLQWLIAAVAMFAAGNMVKK